MGKSGIITVAPNTYYIATDITNDTLLHGIYPDSYDGQATTAKISGGPAPSYYLATLQLPEVPSYGNADEFKSLHFSWYTNIISGSTAGNTINPAMQLYKVKDGFNITEGTLTPVDNTLLSFSSTLSSEVNWMEEDFDGINKGFGDHDLYAKETISGYYKEAKSFSINAGSKMWDSGLMEWLGRPSYIGIWDGVGPGGEGFGSLMSKPVLFEKKGNEFGGGWYPHGVFEVGSNSGGQQFISCQDALIGIGGFTDSIVMQFLNAYSQNDSQGGSKFTGETDKLQVDETYTGRVTQWNSIFAYVQESKDIRDVKVQTIEGTGDNDKSFTESKISFTTDDSYTGGTSMRLYSLWENYSGTMVDIPDDNAVRNVANPYGYTLSGLAYPQTNVCQIWNIPEPMHYTRASGGAGYGSGNGYYPDITYAPPKAYDTCSEIEITFKVEHMLPTPAIQQTALSARLPSLGRSFTIMMSNGNMATNGSENFINFLPSLSGSGDTSGTQAAGAIGWVFINREDGAGTLSGSTLQCCPLSTSGSTVNYWNWPHLNYNDSQGAMIPYLDITKVDSGSDNNKSTYLPASSWIRMRIKIDRENQQAMAYFPDFPDANGLYPASVCTYRTNSSDTTRRLKGAWWPHIMTLATCNMRSINASGATNPSHVNAFYGVDNVPDEDSKVSVLIDSIKFIQWSPLISNNTVNEMNVGRRTELALKTPSSLIPYDNRMQKISVNAGGTAVRAADNYFGINSNIASTVLSFGFDTEITDTKHLFLQGFETLDSNNVSPLTSYIMANRSGSDQYYGHMGVISGATYRSNAAGYEKNISLDGGGLLVSGTGGMNIRSFRNKGMIEIDGSDSEFDNWEARENPYVSARILSVDGTGKQITVDNPQIFDIPIGNKGTPLVAYQVGMERGRGVYGSGTCGFATALYQSKRRVGNIIHLNRSIKQDDSGTMNMATVGDGEMGAIWNPAIGTGYKGQETIAYGGPHIQNLAIGPKQFWITIMTANAISPDSATSDGMEYWGEWFGSSGYSIANDTEGIMNPEVTMGQNRSYSSAQLVSATGTIGTTANESIYTLGPYDNRWSWSTTDPNRSMLELETDYGYGSVVEVDGAWSGTGYINANYPISGNYTYSDITPLLKGDDLEWNSNCNLFLRPSNMANLFSPSNYYDITIDTGEGTNKPQLILGVEDNIPKIISLESSPSIDFLKENTDLEKVADARLANSLSLTWGEEADDVWYRLLYVDAENIANKYHQSTFWAPLNASGATQSYYTHPEATAVDLSVSGGSATVERKIDGFQGWGTYFTGGVGGPTLSSSASLLIASGTKFSCTAHVVPNSVSDAGYIYSVVRPQFALDLHQEAFALRWETGDKIAYNVSTSTGMISGTSRTSFDNDGVQPLSVVFIYDGDAETDNVKLYVNNHLEDTQTQSGIAIVSGNVGVGGLPNYAVGSRWTGFVEEIVATSGSVYAVPNLGNYTLDTSTLPDMNNNDLDNDYQARLFVFDYHNIRGKTPQQVARSNTISWNSTGVS
jgi:hypothetical protein